jgi:hypothetical protein
VAAFVTFAAGIIFEKFNRCITLRTRGVKDGIRFPVFRILTRAFHCFPLSIGDLKLTTCNLIKVSEQIKIAFVFDIFFN